MKALYTPSLVAQGGAALAPEPKANILLVDDSPTKLLALESVLDSLGQNLLQAHSAEEALRYLLYYDVAVIVLDVNMPDLDGFALAELIRQRQRSRHTPIIFISAISPTQTHAFKGYELGAVDYIYTPTPEILRAKVAVFVELCKKTEQVKRYADALHELNTRLEQQVAERTAALQRSNDELQQFTHAASHDLKEPLRGIHNYAYLLLEELGNTVDAEARTKLETLIHLTQRMEDLINSLLHFSRIGQVPLDCAESDLNAVVQEALGLLHITLTQQSVDVRIPRPLPVVRCDRVQVREVFNNLITNAVKYHDKPNKWLEIGYEVSAPQDQPEVGRNGTAAAVPVYTFYVRDNGIGMRPQHLEMIFTMFKRLHPHDAYGGGSGAGLAIAKRIVERHGGAIWAESVYGEGATFYFTLQGGVTAHGGGDRAGDSPDRGQ